MNKSILSFCLISSFLAINAPVSAMELNRYEVLMNTCIADEVLEAGKRDLYLSSFGLVTFCTCLVSQYVNKTADRTECPKMDALRKSDVDKLF